MKQQRDCFIAACSSKPSIFMKVPFNPGKGIITRITIDQDFSRGAQGGAL
jgi:hypothetical protein